MDSIILAGGLGKRLGDIAKDTPKALLRVGEECVLDYLMESLNNLYTTHQIPGKCYLTINPKHKRYFENYEKMHGIPFLELVVENPEDYDPEVGPINGMYQAYANHVSGGNVNEVMVLAGDNISSLDLFDFYKFFQQDSRRSVIAVYDSGGKKLYGKYGRVELAEGNILKNFKETTLPEFSQYINTTNYIFTDEDMRNIGRWLGDRPKENLFEWLMNQGSTLQAYKFKGHWFDIGTLEKLEEANEFFTPTGQVASTDYQTPEYTPDPHSDIIKPNRDIQHAK